MNPVHQNGKMIFGRVYFGDGGPRGSGWVLQYFETGRLCAVELGIEVREAVLAAVADAADFLSCRPENIQVGKTAWAAAPRAASENRRSQRRQEVRLPTEPRARVYFATDDVLDPGWYVQFRHDGRLDRVALWQSDPDNLEAARTEAAWLLGCHPDEILVGGDLLEWPGDRDRSD